MRLAANVAGQVDDMLGSVAAPEESAEDAAGILLLGRDERAVEDDPLAGDGEVGALGLLDPVHEHLERPAHAVGQSYA